MKENSKEKSQEMYNLVQEAIGIINNRKDVSLGDYLEACKYLVDHRDKLPQRVFISLPGGLSGNRDGAWDTVKAGSEKRCSCGNERVIIPLNPRTEFEAASKELVVAPDQPVYLKPVGGDKTSAYVRLEIKQELLIYMEDPCAPAVFMANLFSTHGYKLQQIADNLPDQSDQLEFSRKFNGVQTPIFAIKEVDVPSSTVIITPDAAVEAFNPYELPDHDCSE